MNQVTKQDIFDSGLALRREVLGDPYVDRAFSIQDEFNEAVQDYVTTHAWGATWARRSEDGELALPKKTRSIMNLAMLAAINRPHELEIHLRFALNLGWTEEELTEALLHLGGYIGVPTAREAMLIADRVFLAIGVEGVRVWLVDRERRHHERGARTR